MIKDYENIVYSLARSFQLYSPKRPLFYVMRHNFPLQFLLDILLTYFVMFQNFVFVDDVIISFIE